MWARGRTLMWDAAAGHPRMGRGGPRLDVKRVEPLLGGFPLEVYRDGPCRDGPRLAAGREAQPPHGDGTGGLCRAVDRRIWRPAGPAGGRRRGGWTAGVRRCYGCWGPGVCRPVPTCCALAGTCRLLRRGFRAAGRIDRRRLCCAADFPWRSRLTAPRLRRRMEAPIVNDGRLLVPGPVWPDEACTLTSLLENAFRQRNLPAPKVNHAAKKWTCAVSKVIIDRGRCMGYKVFGDPRNTGLRFDGNEFLYDLMWARTDVFSVRGKDRPKALTDVGLVCECQWQEQQAEVLELLVEDFLKLTLLRGDIMRLLVFMDPCCWKAEETRTWDGCRVTSFKECCELLQRLSPPHTGQYAAIAMRHDPCTPDAAWHARKHFWDTNNMPSEKGAAVASTTVL